MSFRVGQRVVCVNDKFDYSMPDFNELFHNLPKKDKTYTIRLYESGRVLLEEIVNPESPFDMAGIEIWDEPGFDSSRFRDLQEALKELSDEHEEPAEYKEPLVEEEKYVVR